MYFDSSGWLTANGTPERGVAETPPDHAAMPVVGQPWPNWTGHEWIMATYATPTPTFIPNQCGTKITHLAFVARLGDAVAITMDLASIGATAQAAAVRLFEKKMNWATYIDLALPETIAAVQSLVTYTFISQAKADAILYNPVTPKEVPISF